jgi:hypothetical protein
MAGWRTVSNTRLVGGFLHGFAGGGSGVASSGSGVASGGSGITRGVNGGVASGGSGVNGGVASGGSGVRRGSGGVRGGVSSFASGGSGVSSGFLRGFDGFFLLGAASEGQGGEGGGEGDLRVHLISTPKIAIGWIQTLCTFGRPPPLRTEPA